MKASRTPPSASPRKKARRPPVRSWSRHIRKVLRQVQCDLGISRTAMDVMNCFLDDIFDRLASEASQLSRISGSKTLSGRDVLTAVRLVLPGELAKHALCECIKPAGVKLPVFDPPDH
mmetsp:Transcript_5052/g.9023  ORF Transcript_5052/g.9023 Transcript_5052/m.9023 type:complete len:118 (+) Transcript_5052:39-392(+)